MNSTGGVKVEYIKCILCDIDSNEVAWEEDGYTARRCPNCGLVYVSPRPTLPEILNMYASDQSYSKAQPLISGAFDRRLRARHHLGIIKEHKSSGSVLEIGAGAGWFLYEARRAGFTVYGIELNRTLAEFMGERLKIPCGASPLDRSSSSGQTFDVICHFDVLSHFYNPIAEFQKMNNRLNNGGLLVFETGNSDFDARYKSLFRSFQLPDHLFTFSEVSLKKLLEQTGFELEKIYEYSIVPQLMFLLATRRIMAIVRRGTPRQNTNVSNQHNNIQTPPDKQLKTSTNKGNFPISFAKNAINYFSYTLRYKVGAIAPQKRRPRTMLIIAHKIS